MLSVKFVMGGLLMYSSKVGQLRASLKAGERGTFLSQRKMYSDILEYDCKAAEEKSAGIAEEEASRIAAELAHLF